MKENRSLLWPVLMLAFSFACGLLVFLTSDAEASDQENRLLQQRPELSFRQVMDSAFQEEMEEYLSDQFPGREELVAMGSEIRLLLGIKDMHEAYVGKDGYYFEKVTEEDIDEKNYTGNLKRILKVKEKHPELSLKVLLVPSSGIMLSEYLPAHARMYDADKWMEEAKRLLPDSIIDPREKLSEAKAGGDQIYYRTDHHWTSRGTYAAYLAWKEASGMPVDSPEKAPVLLPVTDSFYGTLYARVTNRKGMGDQIEIYQPSKDLSVWINQEASTLYHMDKADQVDKYQIFLGGNYGLVDIQSKSSKKGEEKTLVLVKDSFANSMIPFLTEDYDRIVVIDPRYYPGSLEGLLKDNPATDILFLYELNNFAIDHNLVKLIRS